MVRKTEQDPQWWAHETYQVDPSIYRWGRNIAEFAGSFTFRSLAVAGALPENQSVLLGPKHNGIIDHPLLAFALDYDYDKTIHYLGLSTLFDHKIIGKPFIGLGGIPLATERTAGWSNMDSTVLPRIHEGIARNELFALYPEGKTGSDYQIGRLHSGIARVALATELDIVPIGIVGNRGAPWQFWGNIPVVAIGEPISPDGHDEDSLMRAYREGFNHAQFDVAMPLFERFNGI